MKQPAVYILASKRNGTLYIGVTSNLHGRVWEHKNNVVEGFTKKYSVHMLVYYELHAYMATAIRREKQIKKWNRAWKLQLIEEKNPNWHDLTEVRGYVPRVYAEAGFPLSRESTPHPDATLRFIPIGKTRAASRYPLFPGRQLLPVPIGRHHLLLIAAQVVPQLLHRLQLLG